MGSRQVNIAYELPLTHVDSYAGIVETMRRWTVSGTYAAGRLPAIGWARGDGNFPAHWQEAPNALELLTSVGALGVSPTPWQTEDGATVEAEDYDGASHRVITAQNIDFAANEDFVILTTFWRGPLSSSGRVASTGPNASGWQMRGGGFNVVGGITTFINWDAAGLMTDRQLCNLMIVGQRGANVSAFINRPIVGVSGACPAGVIGAAQGFVLGAANPATPNNQWNGDITRLLVWRGVGIAAGLLANSNEGIGEILRRVDGTSRRVGGMMPTFARTSSACGADRNGRHHIYSPGLPRAGDSTGYAIEPAVTNYCYNTKDITVATGWLQTGGAITPNVDDSIAMALGVDGDVSRWGRVMMLANADGVNRYIYSACPIGVTTACHLMAIARAGSGTGFRLGWYEPTGGVWTDVGPVSDGYVITRLQNTSPPNTNCRLAFLIPDKCSMYVVAPHAGRGANAPCWPVPNPATAATAAKPIDALTVNQYAVRDGAGAIEMDIAPLTTPGVTGYIYAAARQGGNTQMYFPRDAANNLYIYSFDGTTVAWRPARVVAPGVYGVHRASWRGASFHVRDPDGVSDEFAYDGSFGGTDLNLYATGTLPGRMRNFRILRRPNP